MAIDTATKRASIAAIGLLAVGPTVVPTGGFDQADRQVIAYSYAGILAAASSPSIIAITTAAICPDLRVTLD